MPKYELHSFIKAIFEADLNTIKKYVEQDSRWLNGSLDGNNNCALHINAMHNPNSSYIKDDIAYYLLAQGARINQPNNNGNTPLHLAVAHKRYPTAYALFYEGANFLALNKNGKLPHEMTDNKDHHYVSDYILEILPTLIKSIKNDDLRSLQQIINKNKTWLKVPLYEHQNILPEDFARSLGRKDILNYLQEEILFQAIREGELETVERLREKLSSLYQNEQTTLHFATAYNHPHIMKYVFDELQPNMANEVDRIDAFDLSPLDYIAFNKNKEAYLFLSQFSKSYASLSDEERTIQIVNDFQAIHTLGGYLRGTMKGYANPLLKSNINSISYDEKMLSDTISFLSEPMLIRHEKILKELILSLDPNHRYRLFNYQENTYLTRFIQKYLNEPTLSYITNNGLFNQKQMSHQNDKSSENPSGGPQLAGKIVYQMSRLWHHNTNINIQKGESRPLLNNNNHRSYS